MKRMILVAMAMAMPCKGVSYEWPYVASVDVTIGSSTTATYTLHMARTVINDDSIPEGATVGEVLRAKGLGTGASSQWEWGGYHRHNSAADPVVSARAWQIGAQSDSWTTVAKRLSSGYGEGRFRLFHDGSKNGGECVGTGMWVAGRSDMEWDRWPLYMWNGGVSGGCLGTPPPDQWCAMKTPTVEIAYGTLTLKDADGSTKTAGVTVECTTGMKYVLRLRDAENETTLDNGGRVTWQADGKDMGETLTGEAGVNSVDLTATLHGPFERTGVFQGSGILFVSYP